MRRVRKLVALLLSLAMVLAMSGMAMAATPVDLSDGEAGGSATFAKDNPTSQGKQINLKKELTVYNFDETSIYAPTISYSYAISAGNADQDITDAQTDHASNVAVSAKTKAGITPNLVTLTGEGQTTGTSTIAWACTETVTAADNGAANYKSLTVDFTNVVFGAAGVYRYVINETVTSYSTSGVTETKAGTAAGSHVRYLDVYVRPVQTGFTDGSLAADWDIYGYVCFYDEQEITDDGDTTTTGAMKTNGFVAGTKDGTVIKADSYYTYNVTVSKTVTNDAYAKATHAFPFTVIFSNANVSDNVDIKTTTTGTVSGFTDPGAGDLSAGIKGILMIKDSSSVKYIGIPNGTTVEVYETNDVSGVTYLVTTTTDGTNNVDNAVISGTAPTSAVTQSTKADYQSTKTTITPTADADDDTAHTIAIDNNLQNISPTGLMFRYGPYVLILLCGALLLFLGVKFMRRNKEEN